MIIKATSHTIKKIWIFFLFIVLVFVAFITTLVNGISIDGIVLPKIKIDQLYIKLDKKLIVTVDSLNIDKATQTDSSLEESAAILENLPYLHQFFSRIDLKQIRYDNETFSLSYEDNLFALQSRHLNLKARVLPLDKWRFNVEIEEALLKDYALGLKGLLNSDLKTKSYRFEGEFDTFGIRGRTLLDLQKTLLSYHVQSQPFSHQALSDFMNFVVTQVELEPIVKAWIHENIVGKTYILHSLEGKFDLATLEYFPLEMKGSANVQDALIAFEPSVPAAHADEIGIRLERDTLLFDIKNPTYESKTLEKADVYIYKLLTKGTGIVVDLGARARLDASIHKILHAFKIDVPLTQTSGLTDASVKLDIRFLPYDLNATGLFKLSPSNFLLSNVPMSTRSGSVELNNTVVTLNKANLRYKNLFDIDTSGVLDTLTGKYNGKVDIHSLFIDFNGNTLINQKELLDQNGTFTIDDNATTIMLPNLATLMSFSNTTNLFEMSDLSLLRPLSPLMQEQNLTKGSLKLFTKDFETFDASIVLDDVASPFLENNQTLNRFDIALTTDTKTIDAYTRDHKLDLHFDKEITLHVKDLNLSIPDQNASLEMPIKTTVFGENSSLIDLKSGKTVLSDRYTLLLHKDQTLLRSNYLKSSFEYEKKRNALGINAVRMDDNVTNALFNKRYFKEGDFSLSIEGKDDRHMKGTFILHKTYIQDLTFFNNLMATINAIPSLLVFSDPSFNQSGYFVENGYIEFSQEGDTMKIEELQLRGSNTDISGKGSVNLAANDLNLNLQIKTLKTFSSAIDMIPLVGGLILGEDKKISTNVDVTGTLENPKVETHLILDTLKSPVNILKRTLELPLEILK
jgi:hypothetical protein